MPGDEASPVGKLAGLQVLDDNEPAAAGAAVERHSGSWKDKKPHQVEVEGWAGGEEDEQGDGEDGSESESSSARTSWSISSARLVPPSPMRGEALRGGMPTAERKTLKRSQSTLTPFTRKKDGEAVVESVTAELESKGLMLDLRISAMARTVRCWGRARWARTTAGRRMSARSVRASCGV